MATWQLECVIELLQRNRAISLEASIDVSKHDAAIQLLGELRDQLTIIAEFDAALEEARRG